jgi:hypothetical protein
MAVEDRNRKRLARLESRQDDQTDEAACKALRRIHRTGDIRPDQIVVRSSFARLGEQLDIAVYSDRRVPPRRLRPPATRLMRSRGCALQFFLTALFEAQCRTRPGHTVTRNRRPLAPLPRAPEQVSWVDLVGASADTVPIDSGRRSINSRDRRLRQIQQALQTLTADYVQLAEFTDPGAKRRYCNFHLLNEAGRRPIGDPVRYAIPEPAELNLFTLDPRIFTNGWVNVLEDSELAFLLMVADLQARDGGNDHVPVPGDIRVGYYGLGTDGYQAHHLLQKAGLLRVKLPEVRRPDGTFKAHRRSFDDIDGAPLSFRIASGGFDHLALPAVIDALRRL